MSQEIPQATIASTDEQNVTVSPIQAKKTFYGFLLSIKLKEAIETIGKMALGFVALCYAVGLIVVNVYLSKFGVYSVGLFRLYYITAGLWALTNLVVPPLIIFLFGGILLSMNQKLRKFLNSKFNFNLPVSDDPTLELDKDDASFLKNKRALAFMTDYVAGLLGLLVLGATALPLFKTIWQSGGWYAVWVLARSILEGLIGVLMIGGIAFIAFYYKSHLISHLVKAYILILLLIFSGMSVITSFAQDVYGYIPAYLGGGSPRTAQMVIKTDPTTKAYLVNMGISFQGDADLTQNVKVLLTTESEILIVIESQPSVYKGMSIRSDMVQAIRYEGQNLF